jgi:FKBP-type peptidyl-prolyl cis-trans isomerase
MNSLSKLLPVLCAAVLLTACGKSQTAATAPAAAAPAMRTTASGLQMQDVVMGQGAEAVAGKNVRVNYTGWLWQNGTRGAKFDSSIDRGQAFVFPLGAGRVIKGWDEGVQGMKVGGKRMLVIPPALGYGERGAGTVIPPNATLLFEVDLLAVE